MMKPLSRLADRWANVPIAAGAIALLLVIAGLAVIFYSASANEAQKMRETQVQAQILAASVTAALDFGDVGTAQSAVNALALNPQVRAAGVYDLRGNLFASYSRLAGRDTSRSSRQQLRDDNLLEGTATVQRGGARIGLVYIDVVRDPVSRRIARYSVMGLLVIMASLVILVLGVAQTALRRVNTELQARARALGAANDELQVQMEERAKAEDQLRQAQKMQALGHLTGGIAHDFNNLLTVIQGSADMLRRPELQEVKRIRFANAIVETAARAAALTSQLLAFARRQPLRPEVMDLNHRITGMADLLDRALGERVTVRIQLREGVCAVEADPAQLEAAVLNVAVNGRDAMGASGTLTISTAESWLGDGHPAAAIMITDTGSGIPPEIVDRIFEPFYTTKEVGKGTGLGLSQVYGFAAQSGGDVRVESEVGRGTTISILLPCTTAPVAAEEESADAVAPPRRGRILVVDDNENVGQLAETLLTELGHTVVRAGNGAEALAIAASAQFDAVFSDVLMPGMDGLELADRLTTVLPGVPVVLTTGFSDEISRSGAAGHTILLKPYGLRDLAAALDKVLHKSSARV